LTGFVRGPVTRLSNSAPSPNTLICTSRALKLKPTTPSKSAPWSAPSYFRLPGALLYANHYGFTPRDSILDYVFGIALVVVPWIAYRFEWRKNADAFDPGSSEGILKQWELDYITNAHLAAKRAAGDPPDL
jgi:hypothetical protein